jgi:hypothetical protein
MEGKLDKFMDNATHYFQKVTETDTFRSVNIIEFHNGQYEVCHRISDANIEAMKDSMSPEDQKDFDDYLETYFSSVDVASSNFAGGRKIIVE